MTVVTEYVLFLKQCKRLKSEKQICIKFTFLLYSQEMIYKYW